MQSSFDDAFVPQRFADDSAILLTTYRKDGTAVATTVSIAVDGDRAFFRTYESAGKAKRLRRDPRVLIRPSTMRGKATGPAVSATAVLLSGDEARHASARLARKHPILHGVLVPLAHRIRRYKTLHYELAPIAAGGEAAAES